MATLDPKTQKLLNDFSKSQPALNQPGVPASKSGVLLGDLLAAALGGGSETYTPATPSDWSPAPTTVGGGLDQSAARLTAAEAAITAVQVDATQALADAAAAQSTAEDAQNQLYNPNGADWTNPDPTTIKNAVDRLATAVAGLLAGTIP
jgi:hypothetical protein